MSQLRVDFYLLEETSPSGVESMACRLIAKAYAYERHVYMHCQSRTHAEEMDNLLWTFEDSSFIPHILYSHAHYAKAAQAHGKKTQGKEQGSPLDSEAQQHASSDRTPLHEETSKTFPTTPILIGWEEPPHECKDVMINISGGIPETIAQFKRVIEIVLNNEEAKSEGRARYRYYHRSKQWDLHMHHIAAFPGR